MTAKERLDRHDRQIAAILKLVHRGMKMFVRLEEIQMETRKELRELAAAQKQMAAAQKQTEKKLQALIDSMRGAGNGHSKRKVDLQ